MNDQTIAQKQHVETLYAKVERLEAENERLTTYLHRIRGANDNPSCYNANVDAVLNEWLASRADQGYRRARRRHRTGGKMMWLGDSHDIPEMRCTNCGKTLDRAAGVDTDARP
jgi:hypothetical protein